MSKFMGALRSVARTRSTFVPRRVKSTAAPALAGTEPDWENVRPRCRHCVIALNKPQACQASPAPSACTEKLISASRPHVSPTPAVHVAATRAVLPRWLAALLSHFQKNVHRGGGRRAGGQEGAQLAACRASQLLSRHGIGPVFPQTAARARKRLSIGGW